MDVLPGRGQDAAKPPSVHSTAPLNKTFSHPNVSNIKAEGLINRKPKQRIQQDTVFFLYANSWLYRVFTAARAFF